jgi:TolB protein
MNKTVSMVLLLLGAATAAPAQPRLAFERQPSVWVANGDGSGQRKIADGLNPAISPNGAFLAFNTVEPGQLLHRIAVADLASGRIKILTAIPSNNCEEPDWSPDGSKLLFVFDTKKDERHIGIVNADGTGFREVPAGLEYPLYYTPVWAADGQSIFCTTNRLHGNDNRNYICRLGLDGRVLKEWLEMNLADGRGLIPGGELGGWRPLHASPDGKSLLLDADMWGEGDGQNEVYTAPAIWTMDLATGKVTRMTPRKLDGWSGQWLDAGDVLFTSDTPGITDVQEFSVFRMTLAGHGRDRKELIRDADTASAGGFR